MDMTDKKTTKKPAAKKKPAPKKRPVGRPSAYRPEFIKKVDEYLNDPEWVGERWEEFHKTRGNSSDTFERVGYVRLPKVEDFSMYINQPLRNIYDWEVKHPDFSQAIDKIRKAQHRMLVDGSVSGRYTPSTVNLMLSTNHGYKIKSDVTSDDKPIPLLGDMLKE